MWTPVLDDGLPTISARLLSAMKRDIGAGILAAGSRLPTHRELAHRLGIAIGTVTAAYTDAARQGLIEARVGRGSFVATARRASEAGIAVNLTHNVPPLGPASERLASTLLRLKERRDLVRYLDYGPPAGDEAHREAGAAWLADHGGPSEIAVDRMIVTAGAQHAATLAFGVLAKSGDRLLMEAATFFGMKTLSRHAGYGLEGLAMDEEGILPDALGEAASDPGRVLYVMPTLQNPTGRTMGVRRRREIAAVARKHDVWIVEDDTFGAYAAGIAPPPLVHFAPERTIYIASLSKILAPGLRTAYLLSPTADLHDRMISAIRATNYTLGMIGSLIATQWIEDGTADAIASEVIGETRVRGAMARQVLGPAIAPSSDACSPHLWMPLEELEAERLVARALRGGVELTPPDAPIVERDLISGVRLCIGGNVSRARYEQALSTVSAALHAEFGAPALSIM